MVNIKTRKADIIWNYAGTIVSMAGNFVLIPFLLVFLSGDEIGLWYVFLSVSNLTLLFDFGFNSTFARNIVYVLSGVKKLSREKVAVPADASSVDWHLLNTVLKTVKLIYASIALVILVVVATLGTWYVGYVTEGIGSGYLMEWVVFCVAMFLNLYFLYTSTYLRGYGDIASENKAKAISRFLQLALTIVLLFAGLGLMGASVGFLAGAVVLRLLSIIYLSKHHEVNDPAKEDMKRVTFVEVKQVLSVVWFIAWRDTIVQLSLYASSQATTILCSLFLSLTETGMFSIYLQIGNALCHFSQAYAKAFLPEFQSAYARDDAPRQATIAGKGIVSYFALVVVGTVGVCLVIMPLLLFFKPDVTIDYLFYCALSVYLLLLNHHSLCCNFIVSMNRIPYVGGYLVAAVIGVVLSAVFTGYLEWGVWGLLMAQLSSQLVYNNWRWPLWLCSSLGVGYAALIKDGCANWSKSIGKKRN